MYARLMAGQGQFLAELRPGVALFVRFAGIDYERDPEAGPKLDAYLRWVQRILARYDGNVLQLTVGDKGSYLCCGWGAPFAHEDDGARALLAALQLQAPPAELAFIGAVQIGISCGRLRTGAYGSAARLTYGILGDEVNLAARLMQAASPGAIYVSAAAYEGDAGRFSWEELLPLTVKGRADAITVYRLLAARERQPLHFQTALYGLPLVGRSDEIAIIRRKITETIGGQGQVVAIVAAAGLGKSRLVVESVRIALDRSMTFFAGECQSYGTNDSYHVWESIWQSFFAIDRSLSPELQIAALREQLADIDPALLPRLPLLGVVLNLPIPDNDLTASLDARLRKASLEALLVDCVRARSRARPTVLVIEDGQWLDPLSHDLLEAIGRAIADMPVLILFAYRPPEVDHLRAPRVTALPHTTVVELSDLNPNEAAELVMLKQIHLDMPAELRPMSSIVSWPALRVTHFISKSGSATSSPSALRRRARKNSTGSICRPACRVGS
ncbi:AAA family ATPase [Candidatus Gracilibacteria bacterium]|nr:AAA family ATPase [Candidatus Gracilibacteria bacterium]